jgi:hypothetical protein
MQVSQTSYNRWKRISGIEDSIEEINAPVKENDKSKKFLTQNSQEIRDIIKRPNLRIIVIEDSQVKELENLFQKNHGRKLP